jgi:hypothetical protein
LQLIIAAHQMETDTKNKAEKVVGQTRRKGFAIFSAPHQTFSNEITAGAVFL